jgi:hypothetical protein
MIQKKKKNNKAVLFFILLVLVGYVFVNFGQSISSKGEVKAEYEEKVVPKPEECTTCGASIEEEIVVEESQINVLVYEDENVVEMRDESVAGVGDFINCNKFNPANILDSVRRVCPTGSSEFKVNDDDMTLIEKIFLGGKIRIDSISEIEMTIVKYPLALFLGQYVMENSNREPSIESPNYPSSGQAIDEGYTLKMETPMRAEELEEVFAETLRKDYTVTANAEIVSGSGTDEVAQTEQEIGVMNAEHEPECLCDEDVSTSDYNPGSANRQGFEAGYFRSQIPGGDPKVDDGADQCLTHGEDYKMMLFGNVRACVNAVGIFKGLVSSLFSIGQWNDCNEEPEIECYFDDNLNPPREVCYQREAEACTDVRNIAVKMSPIFGEPDECTEELCANAYLTKSYMSGLTPEQAGGKKTATNNPEESLMFFVGTPCEARIKVGAFSRLVPVTCLWDASPLLLDYKLQAMFRNPGDENFPSAFEIYWALVDKAVEASAEVYDLL